MLCGEICSGFRYSTSLARIDAAAFPEICCPRMENTSGRYRFEMKVGVDPRDQTSLHDVLRDVLRELPADRSVQAKYYLPESSVEHASRPWPRNRVSASRRLSLRAWPRVCSIQLTSIVVPRLETLTMQTCGSAGTLFRRWGTALFSRNAEWQRDVAISRNDGPRGNRAWRRRHGMGTSFRVARPMADSEQPVA